LRGIKLCLFRKDQALLIPQGSSFAYLYP